MTLPNIKFLYAVVALSVWGCSPQEPSSSDPAASLVPDQSLSSNSSASDNILPSASHTRESIANYCLFCHDDRLQTAGLRLDLVDFARVTENPEVLEKVVQKLRTGTMPPADMPQPSNAARSAMLAWLETSLDEAAAANPNPGRTETLRRLNRTEYRNSVRDLLALDIDVSLLLPPDESGHGFDNVNVGDLSPILLDRYISAAQKISRLAVGGSETTLQEVIIRVPADLTQEQHIAGLPIGTRGGVSVSHTFPQDGAYDIQIRLARNRTGDIGGLRSPQALPLELLLDRKIVETFSVIKPDGPDHSVVDANFKIRVAVTAGPHDIGVTFPKQSSALLETERQPLQAHYNEIRHPRLTPAIYQVSIMGPYGSQAAGDTPSRRQIFVCRPTDVSTEEACAKQILTKLMRRAFRRPVSDSDLEGPMAFYRLGRSEGDFDEGVEKALGAVLINPEFLFRVELQPEQIAAGSAYRISDIELASRLSFFLWSSLPDEELLDAAAQGELSQADGLERQTRRMLADPRSNNLATNFAGQWLQLLNLEAFSPNPRLYPDFDNNLRQAFREETERFVDSIVREDRSVLDLLDADYTFLNERLAKHYSIAGVYGSRFRRVHLAEDSKRGGLLRQGSVLAVTSYATRTSPVLRGVWVLDNIYGAPPAPPPADVPALDESSVATALPMRERLAAHRDNPVCASCHRIIDPAGFPLENYDAVGRWRDHDGDNGLVDVSGGLPGMDDFQGVAGLQAGLLNRPELFATTLTEKLLTFALGRGTAFYDAPAIRKITRAAEADGYRLSSIILGIVNSTPFQMRRSI